MPDFFQANAALAYFCTLSEEERTYLVEKTSETQDVKLETLKNAITANYDSVRNTILEAISVEFNYSSRGIGSGLSSNRAKAIKTFRDLITKVADKFKEAQWNAAQAIDVYTGARAYADECTLGSGYTDYSGYGHRIQIDDAEQQVMEKLGYASLEDFVDEILKYDVCNVQLSIEDTYAYLLKQYHMVKDFEDKLSEVYEPAIRTKEEEGLSKYDEQCIVAESGKAQLNYIITNPPTTPKEINECRLWIIAPIGYTFMQTVIGYKAQSDEDSIDSPKVEVNGKEYEVGKKYQEKSPDGKPRIVIYDRLGNKWDIRGFKVSD